MVLATLLSEASVNLSSRNHKAPRNLGSVAHETRCSVCSCVGAMRWAGHLRLRLTLYHRSRVAIQHDGVNRIHWVSYAVAITPIHATCAMHRDDAVFT